MTSTNSTEIKIYEIVSGLYRETSNLGGTYYTTCGQEVRQAILALLKDTQTALLDKVEAQLNGMYELAITDLELRQHQEGVEIPVVSKTELITALTKLRTEIDGKN